MIHSYGDGKGRVGRVLIAWVLTRRLGMVSPPPVSVRIAADRGGYLSELTPFRLGDVDPWVSWFARVVRDAGDATVNLVRSITEHEARRTERLADVRAGAAARRVLAVLPAHPVLTAQTAAAAIAVSERACRTALDTPAEHDIVQPFRPAATPPDGPPLVVRQLVDLVTSWSR